MMLNALRYLVNFEMNQLANTQTNCDASMEIDKQSHLPTDR